MSGPELEQIKMQIQKAGHLRFRIAADLQEDRQICTLADHPSQKGRRTIRDRSGEQVAEWGKIMLVVKPEQRKDAPKQRFDDGEIVAFKTRPEFTTVAELQRFKDGQRAAGHPDDRVENGWAAVSRGPGASRRPVVQRRSGCWRPYR